MSVDSKSASGSRGRGARTASSDAQKQSTIDPDEDSNFVDLDDELSLGDIPDYTHDGHNSAYTPSESASRTGSFTRWPVEELAALRVERERVISALRRDLPTAGYRLPQPWRTAPGGARPRNGQPQAAALAAPRAATAPAQPSEPARDYAQQLPRKVDDAVSGAVRALTRHGSRPPDRSPYAMRLSVSVPTLPRESPPKPATAPQRTRGFSSERPVTSGAVRALDVTRSAALLPVEMGDALLNLSADDTSAAAAAADFVALERRALALQGGRIEPRLTTEVTAKRTALAALKCASMKSVAVERLRNSTAVRQRLARERRAVHEAREELRARAPALFHGTPFARYAPPPVPAPKAVLELGRLALEPHYATPAVRTFPERPDYS